MSNQHASEYAEKIIKGDRSVLSRAITLVESTRSDHRYLSEQILDLILPYTGRSIRVGITGIPGVGKSTFIESIGRYIISGGRKLAILAIDPSSNRSRGSILGDKTRMSYLSTREEVFIRPSPASGMLGGVARKTRETMLLCEAAGFDTILVETTGIGQSETNVHSMVDFYLLLTLAGAGDDLQGIKRGVMEMVHLIAINKTENPNLQAAEQHRKQLENALSLFPASQSGWKPPVRACSAVEGTGIEEIWNLIEKYITEMKTSGYFEQHREEQVMNWMHESINRQLQERFYNHPEIKIRISNIEADVKSGNLSPFKAASELLRNFNV